MNKKGFTLIEVLAVLLILSVIALITTPIIINVIKDSKEKAFINDANSLVESIRTYQANNQYESVIVDYTNNINTDKLELDGDLPDAGQISIDENGKVALALWNEDLQICAQKDLNSKEVVKKEISKSACTL